MSNQLQQQGNDQEGDSGHVRSADMFDCAQDVVIEGVDVLVDDKERVLVIECILQSWFLSRE